MADRKFNYLKESPDTDDIARPDMERGFTDAAPSGDYEGELGDDYRYVQDKDGNFVQEKVGTLHAGQIEPDGWQKEHAPQDMYGFVRRPTHKTDVERN